MNAPEIVDFLEKIPSCSSNGYGKPFNDIFKGAGYDFYKIDKSLLAEVIKRSSSIHDRNDNQKMRILTRSF